MPDVGRIFHPWLRIVSARSMLGIEKELPGLAAVVVAIGVFVGTA